MNIIKTIIAATLLVATFSSCSDKDNVESYFHLEEDKTGATIPASGIAKKDRVALTVRSNSGWKVIPATDEDAKWIHIFVDEGENDGIFYYWIDANKSFNPRTGNIEFLIDGTFSPTLFRIDQEADVPMVAIENAGKGYELLPTGGQIKVPIKHNVDFTATLSKNEWAQIDSIGNDTVYISAEKNRDAARTVTLQCSGTGEYSALSSKTILSQAAAGVYLNEHFDWIQEGEEDFYYNYPEVRFDKWTNEEIRHGWTSLGDCMYGGRGYLKLGKTNDAGDLVSPKLSAIQGSVNVTITFKAIGYVSKAGAKDDGIIKLMLTGSGELSGETLSDIDVNGKTYKAATREVTVFPNSSKNEYGENYDPWSQPEATFTIHAKGITAETQLLFVGGAKWGKELKGQGQGKNRVLIDDIKVVEE